MPNSTPLPDKIIEAKGGLDKPSPKQTSGATKSLTVDEQLKLADSIIGMLVSRVWRDETTDPTGYTITKRKLGEHAGKVMEDIKRGALQPIKRGVI